MVVVWMPWLENYTKEYSLPEAVASNARELFESDQFMRTVDRISALFEGKECRSTAACDAQAMAVVIAMTDHQEDALLLRQRINRPISDSMMLEYGMRRRTFVLTNCFHTKLLTHHMLLLLQELVLSYPPELMLEHVATGFLLALMTDSTKPHTYRCLCYALH